jgi:hypothetical protein
MKKTVLINLSSLFSLQPEQVVVDALVDLQYQRYWSSASQSGYGQRFFAAIWHSRPAYQVWLKGFAAYHIFAADGMINRYKKGQLDTRTFLQFLLDKVCPALNDLSLDEAAYAKLKQQKLLSTGNDAEFTDLSELQRYRLALLEEAWNRMIGELHPARITQLQTELHDDALREIIFISNTNPMHVRCILGKSALQLGLTATAQPQPRYGLQSLILHERLCLYTSYHNGQYKTDGLVRDLVCGIRAQDSGSQLNLVSHWEGDRIAAQALGGMAVATPEQYFTTLTNAPTYVMT